VTDTLTCGKKIEKGAEGLQSAAGLVSRVKNTIFSIILFSLVLFTGCNNSPQNKILGTWTGSTNSGFEEITFKNDNTCIIKWFSNTANDSEETSTYKIMDDILCINDYISNYYLIKNKLIITWGDTYAMIYTKKNGQSNLPKIKKALIGSWSFSADNKFYEMIFLNNDMVNIKEYVNGSIITDKQYPYTISEYYINITGFNFDYKDSLFSIFYNGIFLYKMEKNKLLIWEYPAGEIIMNPIYLEKGRALRFDN
jgi:hypothetical protein